MISSLFFGMMVALFRIEASHPQLASSTLCEDEDHSAGSVFCPEPGCSFNCLRVSRLTTIAICCYVANNYETQRASRFKLSTWFALATDLGRIKSQTT